MSDLKDDPEFIRLQSQVNQAVDLGTEALKHHMAAQNGNGKHDPTDIFEVFRQSVESGAYQTYKHSPVPVQLPSGMVALMRPVGLDVLLKGGRLPDFLTPMIMQALNGKEPTLPTLDDPAQLTELVTFLSTCCALAFVLPRVVEKPQGDDEISADDIELGDKYAVFQLLGKPRRWLETFRPKPVVDVRGVDDESGVSQDAEPAGEAEAPAETGTTV